MTIQVKSIEQYLPVVLFVMLCEVVVIVQSMDEILKCDHDPLISTSCVAFDYAVNMSWF